MSNRNSDRRLLRASPCVPAATGGMARCPSAGIAAWQVAGNGMHDGGGRVPRRRSAMR